MKFSIVLHFAVLLVPTLASRYGAQEFRSFHGICSELLDLSPYYRRQLNERHIFPDDSVGHRFVYCLSGMIGLIDPMTVKINTDAMYAQFGRDASLAKFRKRVDQCEKRARGAEDRFEKTYRLFGCFEEDYVRILDEEADVPDHKGRSRKVPSHDEFLELEESCADILDVSNGMRVHIRQHRYPDTAESHQFTYCTAVLFFDYKPDVGLDMNLMYAVFGQGEGRQQFGRAKKDCFERNGAYKEGLTRFESLYRMYRCFADRYASFFE